jgi:hypothetical protein
MNIWQILQLIFGTAESIVPIFIHNPVSQRIESVIVTTADNALAMVAQTATQNQTAQEQPK